jgi:Secretion system C-terminal sorting domain
MKKILLLTSVAAMMSSVVFGQMKTTVSADTKKGVSPTRNVSFSDLAKHREAVKKTRGVTQRTYNYVDAIDKSNGGTVYGNFQANVNTITIWDDSTMKALYNVGGGVLEQDNIFAKNFCQVLDPSSAAFNLPSSYGGELQLDKGESFKIDSVGVYCIYSRNPSKANIVDTLIISVSGPQNLLYFRETQAALLNKFPGVDSIFVAAAPFNFTTRAIDATTNVYTFKYPLTAASEFDTIPGGWNYIDIPVNLNVTSLGNGNAASGPKANPIAMNVHFKSGDVWVKNVDSLGSGNTPIFNNIRLVSFEESVGTFGPSPRKREFNFSGLMRHDTTNWGELAVPALYFNSPDYSYDMHWFDYVLSCNNNCGEPVTVSKITANKFAISATPNPANNNVVISADFINNPKNIVITIVNSFGQTVKTIRSNSVNNAVKSVINVSDLARGMYIYTINADGLSQSGKLSVN